MNQLVWVPNTFLDVGQNRNWTAGSPCFHRATHFGTLFFSPPFVEICSAPS